jgi:hypothetical protein
MFTSRKTTKILTTLFNHTTNLSNKNFLTSFFLASRSMTNAYINHTHQPDNFKSITNLGNFIKDLKINNDNVINNEINKARLHCIQRCLEIANASLIKEDTNEAGEKASKILAELEEVYGKINATHTKEIKRLFIEAYTIQGKAYMNGTFNECKLALQALKTAHELDPDNKGIKRIYECLSIDMGIAPENQIIIGYPESLNKPMKK